MAQGIETENIDWLSSAHAALGAITELETFVSLCWEGLGYAEKARDVFEVVRKARRGSGDTGPVAEARLEHIDRLEKFAAVQKSQGFSYLYGLAINRLWAIMETFAEDAFIELVTAHPELRNLPRIGGLKGPLIEFASAPPFKQAELLRELLSADLSAPLKRGVGRFDCMFEAVGLSGPVGDNVRRCFVEMQEIRNVVTHRRGIADERFVTNCSWFGAKLGEPILVPPKLFTRYTLAASLYVVEVSRRVVNRYPPKPGKLSLEEHRKQFDEILTSSEASLGN